MNLKILKKKKKNASIGGRYSGYCAARNVHTLLHCFLFYGLFIFTKNLSFCSDSRVLLMARRQQVVSQIIIGYGQLSSWLQASAWPRLNCCRHLGNELIDERYISVCFSSYLSGFQINNTWLLNILKMIERPDKIQILSYVLYFRQTFFYPCLWKNASGE